MKKLLSPPTTPVFFISLAIALVAALAATGHITGIPLAPVWLMGIGYAVLAVACLMRRL
jgi:hypothetical protein